MEKVDEEDGGDKETSVQELVEERECDKARRSYSDRPRKQLSPGCGLQSSTYNLFLC